MVHLVCELYVIHVGLEMKYKGLCLYTSLLAVVHFFFFFCVVKCL